MNTENLAPIHEVIDILDHGFPLFTREQELKALRLNKHQPAHIDLDSNMDWSLEVVGHR